MVLKQSPILLYVLSSLINQKLQWIRLVQGCTSKKEKAVQRFDMKQTAGPGACAEALLDMIDALLKLFFF